MADQPHFLVRFWGVRGSYPTPGPHTLRHGGNTSCVEIEAGSHTLIFDAGSGIIGLGAALMQRSKDAQDLNLALFITHAHNDHLLGFPFFSPLFDAHTNLHLFGPQLAGQTTEQLVTSLMSPPYFPVDVRKLPSRRTYTTVEKHFSVIWREGQAEPKPAYTLSGAEQAATQRQVKVSGQFTSVHPSNGAVVYRIEYAGHTVVYATDVEWKHGCEEDFLRFIKGADILIHDAQYTQQDYNQNKQGFGHSTIEMAAEAAQRAQVKQLVLFHHEPTYDDAQLDQMEAIAREYFAHSRSAYEGLEIDLLASQ